MYTRCPSCRAEICFDPPANAANLPEGYKHKIRCPSCGVTIGVKIPSVTAVAGTQPTFTPQNPNAARPEEAVRGEVRTEKADKYAGTVEKTLSGRPRSCFCFIMGLLLFACSIVGYLFNAEYGSLEILGGLAFFDGITLLTNIEVLQLAFELSVADGLVTALPVIFFLAAGVTFLGALICFIIGRFKVARFLNFIWSLGMLALSACIIFRDYLGSSPTSTPILEYLMELLADGAYLIVVPAVISLIYVLFSFGFMCKPMKKRVPAPAQ